MSAIVASLKVVYPGLPDEEKEIPVPLALVDAFKMFSENKLSGRVEIHFKNGNPVGVETNSRQILK